MNTTVLIGKCSLLAILALSPIATAALSEVEELCREPRLATANPLDCAFVLIGGEDSESSMFEIRTKQSSDHVKVHIEKNASWSPAPGSECSTRKAGPPKGCLARAATSRSLCPRPFSRAGRRA